MDHDHDLDCPDPIECARVNALYEKFADLAASVWLAVEMDLPEDRQLRWVAELEIAFHKLPDIDKLSLVEMLLAPIAQARGEVALGRIGGDDDGIVSDIPGSLDLSGDADGVPDCLGVDSESEGLHQ